VSQGSERELELYRTRYETLLEEARRDYGELVDTGVMSRARELSVTTGEHFNHNELPLFFTGDLDASFVLVHLNPKQANNTAAKAERPLPVESFEEYLDTCRHFGARVYGHDSPRTHRSPFDHKQIRFLEPFGVIDFVEEKTKDDRFTNLERALDHKLQLELIPYGSDSFSGRGLTAEVLQPHYARIMRVITARPREYVVFCGAVFGRLFSPYIEEEHGFRLRKTDGNLAQQTSRFANLRLPYGGTEITAGLAYSWAQQGIPMKSYAEAVRDRYGSSASREGASQDRSKVAGSSSRLSRSS